MDVVAGEHCAVHLCSLQVTNQNSFHDDQPM